MADPGAKETDQILREIEKRINIEYRQAARELESKVNDYWGRHKIKDQTWQRWVQDGTKTKAEYEAWLTSQLMNGERWEKMRDTIAEDLTNTDKIAKSITRGHMPDVYSTNFAYGTFEIERGSGVDTSFTLYSRESLEFLFRENPQLLPDPGKKVSKEIAEGKAKRWNSQHLQSVMAQAILQGNSIPDIATRLSNAVCDSNRKAAIRNARTMATGAQNAGRINAYKRGEELGIKSKKKWIATLNMRTRHEHRILDGMSVPLDEPFVVEGEKIRYPGDPTAAAHLVYNCRCTLIADVAGWTSNAISHRSEKQLEEEGLTYEEWKESRKEVSNPIDLPERKQEAIRAQFILGYRGYGGPVAPGRDMSLDIDSKLEVVQETPPAGFTPVNHAYEEGGRQEDGKIITSDGYTVLDRTNTPRSLREFMTSASGGGADGWFEQLTDKEKEALEWYSTNGYSGINSYLRRGTADLGTADERSREYLTTDAPNYLKSAIDKYKLPTPMVFTRIDGTDLLGGANTKEDLEKLVGSEVIDRGFMSTASLMTKSIERELYYNGAIGGNGNLMVRYHIKTDAGTGIGAYLGNDSSNKIAENEFIFNKDSRFLVEGVYQTVYTKYGNTEVPEIHVNLRYLGRDGDQQEPEPQTFAQKISALRDRISGTPTENDLKEAGALLAQERTAAKKAEREKLDAVNREFAEWKSKTGYDKWERIVDDEDDVGYSFQQVMEASNKLKAYHKTDEFKDLLHRVEEARAAYNGTDEENIEWLKNKLSEIRGVGLGDLHANTFLSGKTELRKSIERVLDTYPRDWVERSADRGVIDVYYADRGHYNTARGDLYTNGTTSTAYHELGHRFESVVSEILEAEKEFYERRTAGEALEPMGVAYKESEKTRRDNFLDKYMGKDYGGAAYELVSMGFEYAYQTPYKLEADKDMESWIYGILCLL